ncbi:MAG: hypothetical protein OJF49_001075 [Ktedonobacterales bacterium]|nr:MAG: hypothetical protein OJF49_001075 [Ktedonobacterales bacterium]
MRITASDLETLATAALIARQVPSETAAQMAREAVLAELLGKKTHGVGKLLSLNLGDPAAPVNIHAVGPLVTADGNSSNGYALLRRLANMAVDVTREFGVAIVTARNFSRYSMLRPYTEIVAAAGYVGILMSSAGPAAVAPFGSADPITGTNPICLSFPSSSGIRTFDFSTSKVVWGEIRQAALEGRALPADTFLNAAGAFTTRPEEVNAVLPFGGAKGSALNVAIELLCGPLVGAKAGLEVESEFDLGAVLLSIDPARTGGSRSFAEAAARLFKEIKQSRPLDPERQVRVPGEPRPQQGLDFDLATVEVEVRDNVINGLKAMSRGEWNAEMASNPLYN